LLKVIHYALAYRFCYLFGKPDTVWQQSNTYYTRCFLIYENHWYLIVPMTGPQAECIETNKLLSPSSELEQSLTTIVGTLGSVGAGAEVTTVLDAIEEPEQLLTIEGHVANFLLFGTPVPPDVNKLAVRNVLRQFAGSDEVVSSEAIANRFTQLNRFLNFTKKETPSTTAVRPASAVPAAVSAETYRTEPMEGYRFPGANCIGLDPKLFFPERGSSSQAARDACHSCIARVVCLEAALEDKALEGIWGGTSQRKRNRIRAARKKEAERAAIVPTKLKESELVAETLDEASNL
jgi:WhiB family redox-sensing transcriptional regulator